MRLIDADKLKDEMVKWLSKDGGIEQRCLVDIDDIAVSVIQTVDEQPTAYDIVHCERCENWEIITTDTIYGRTVKIGQCELTKWVCGGKGYCMHGKVAE